MPKPAAAVYGMCLNFLVWPQQHSRACQLRPPPAGPTGRRARLADAPEQELALPRCVCGQLARAKTSWQPKVLAAARA